MIFSPSGGVRWPVTRVSLSVAGAAGAGGASAGASDRSVGGTAGVDSACVGQGGDLEQGRRAQLGRGQLGREGLGRLADRSERESSTKKYNVGKRWLVD